MKTLMKTPELDFHGPRSLCIGTMAFTAAEVVARCPSCERTRMRRFARADHLGISLYYQICCYCGLVFMSPRFSEEQLKNFYVEEYRRLYNGEAGPTKSALEEQHARAAHLGEIVGAEIPKVDSHLDIGCSAGELLGALRSRWPQAKSVGIEPSQAYRAWCQSNGWIVFRSMEELRAEPQERFELVSLSHVVEHLPDPVGYLTMLRHQALAPRGWLLIEVPNLYGHASFEIAHLSCFYDKTLADVLLKAGYCIVFWKFHSIPRGQRSRPKSDLKLGQRYITVLARPLTEGTSEHHPVRKAWPLGVSLRRHQGLSGRSLPWFLLRAPLTFGASVARKLGWIS